MRRVAVASVLGTAFLLAPAAATARSASGWGRPQLLVPVGKATYSPAAATAPNGTTVIVWDQENSHSGKFRLLAGTRLLSGKVKITKLGPMTGAFPQAAIAVGGEGTFAVVWGAPAKGTTTRIAVRIWSSGKRSFGPTMYLSPGNANTEYAQDDVPDIAVDDSGTVFVVWEGAYGKGSHRHYRVVERQLAKHSRKWSSPVLISPVAQVDAHAGKVAANGNGNAAVSWTEETGAVKARILRAGAKGFGPVQQISPSTFGVSAPTITMSDHGKTALVWEQSATAGRRIASKVTSGTTFPKRGQFLSGKGTAEFQSAALASDGSGVTAWEKIAGVGGQVLARVITASGHSWTQIVNVTQPGVALLGASGPSVAATTGHAFVAWSQKVKNKISIGVKVRVGGRWLATRTYPALTAPVVSAANDPVSGARVLGAVVWTSTKGLQIATFR